jgi:glutamine synthetase type III
MTRYYANAWSLVWPTRYVQTGTFIDPPSAVSSVIVAGIPESIVRCAMADDWKTKVPVLRFIAAIAHEAHQILGLLGSRYNERREGTRRRATK